jgi:hypothetical protein
LFEWVALDQRLQVVDSANHYGKFPCVLLLQPPFDFSGKRLTLCLRRIETYVAAGNKRAHIFEAG